MPRITDFFNPLEGKQLCILNEEGDIINKELNPQLSQQEVKKLYEAMLLIKIADEKALALQRSGRMGTFAQVRGQEAQVAAVLPMQKQDWVVPSFRETGVLVMKGMPLENFYLLFMGCEEGSRMPKEVNALPVSVPVGSQTLHAVGIAWGMKIKKEKACSIVFFGDGGSSEGDFHEAMNFAGVFKTPTIFVCQNNQYAISVPRVQQTASKTIAQKAVAYGFQGIQIDGNDIFAWYVAVKDAVDHARKGNGPTLIEAVTYRLCPHTTADDPTAYRSDAEVKVWEKKDPILRVRKYMEKKKWWNKKEEEKTIARLQKQVEDAVKRAESTIKKVKVEDMFQYMYAEITPELKEQLEYVKKFIGAKGE